jgi:membrane-associated phospholipid phosphatase
VHAAISHAPLIGLQRAFVDQDVPLRLLAAAAVALWFRRPTNGRFRARVLIAFLACLVTSAVASGVQHLAQRLPPAASAAVNWGSFPSDRTALFAIAAAIAFMVGRRYGVVVLGLALYACFFRIGDGDRWPSDIAGGVLLGTTIVLLLLRCRHAFDRLLARTFSVIANRPALAAAIATLLLFEFSDGFRVVMAVAALAFDFVGYAR